MAKTYNLGAVDYVVFGVFMLLSVGIGFYYWLREKMSAKWTTTVANEKNDEKTDEYLVGSRKMPIIPVAMSLLATFLSGITLLGTPAEIFKRGLLWALMYYSAVLAFAISGYFFVPIFYNLKLTSVFEYLEVRFHSRLLKLLCAAVFLVNTIVYMGVVIYAPSVALSGVSDVEVWKLILLIGCTTTLYTTIGGIKAVVWTDTLQAVVMYAGIGLIIVKGVMESGGWARTFEILAESGRLESLWRVDPDPAQHLSVWVVLTGGTTLWLSLYGLNQMAIQRYCSLPSLGDARKVVCLTCGMFLVVGTMACFIGVVCLAYYYNCDPVKTGVIDDHDQLVVLLAVEVLSDWPGFSGLFLACIFAMTLSTLSSGFNSFGAVVYTDFIKPTEMGKQLGADGALKVNKIVVLLAGCISTAFAFAAKPLGGIIKSSLSLLGALIGPVLGLFFLGVFFTRVSTKATVCSFLLAMFFSIGLWTLGAVENPYSGYVMPTNSSAEGCSGEAFTETPIYDYDPHYGRPGTSYLGRM
ncbi:hypothetical protein QR680_008307 [Steinernema hermaphroditum]|uniref:Uncharacterized protein n=1 Tax=Steinernema hermaphroditum TaxID=289476 RepID=A0AA39IIF7_9BILA|nr:hypothetical protein QR680_008307 [Steinernema hermaphroditum]